MKPVLGYAYAVTRIEKDDPQREELVDLATMAPMHQIAENHATEAEEAAPSFYTAHPRHRTIKVEIREADGPEDTANLRIIRSMFLRARNDYNENGGQYRQGYYQGMRQALIQVPEYRDMIDEIEAKELRTGLFAEA